MHRYCPNCRKKYDFKVQSAEELSRVVCPVCGEAIGAYGKADRFNSGGEKVEDTRMEDGIGTFVAKVFHIAYLFYLVLAIAGVIAYFCEGYKVLYVITGVALGCYLLQWVFHTVVFWSGIFLLPLGAVVGYLLLHSLPGACLGILVVFILRHLGRDIIWRFIDQFIKWGSD